MMYEHGEIANKETEIIGRSQTDILKLKRTITEIKKFTIVFNRRYKLSGERISGIEIKQLKLYSLNHGKKNK